MATAPSANDLTRQQLDELDDLLQRMLNLPLTGTEPPPAPTGPTWRYDTPVAPPAPAPHLAAPPEPPRAPVYAAPPLVAPPPPPVVRPEPITAPVPLLPPPEPTTPIIERKPTPPSRPPSKAAPKPPPVAAAPPPPPPAPVPQVVYDPPPPLPVLLWPLAVLNWVFDRLAGLLGPPGWLLRSGFGKNVLGLAGIGLLVYTAAHLATDAGWVELPFPVPWPR